jgi:hypothetical protein
LKDVKSDEKNFIPLNQGNGLSNYRAVFYANEFSKKKELLPNNHMVVQPVSVRKQVPLLVLVHLSPPSALVVRAIPNQNC